MKRDPEQTRFFRVALACIVGLGLYVMFQSPPPQDARTAWGSAGEVADPALSFLRRTTR